MRTTFMARPQDVQRQWYVIDADGVPLGRLASQVAKILRGKHKPIYTPHVDTGDHVIVVNAEKVRLTGKKLDKKVYYRHTGYPGGLKAITARRLLETRPERMIELAVRRMLPRNALGRRQFRKLHVYRGPDHPHAAQRPRPLTIRPDGTPQWEQAAAQTEPGA
ncbi:MULTISPECIES: 50S ribosomal protein L13 [Thermaerobacter]|uniref:Large ribosomal subunit protein uL13 n=1 Tax=Thermaerobacter composti TaxID=554949 RepID=A0ABZ0QRJ5_9FIRM|nr:MULTISPECIES: 50S ribosomal protein L13 [Thermaerobacter]PZN09179.1 MAG: 50S ribosomal protein L13 [Bacillota bacterium]QBS36999.1 50S ribosomal protein L13 [Thermaerobacter sp. FW80]WPD19010.1 50S ribosomal protein L13 [Thermaerobacter composti]